MCTCKKGYVFNDKFECVCMGEINEKDGSCREEK